MENSSKSHLTFSNNILKWPQLNSYRFLWTANHIRGPWTNFTFSPWRLTSLLAILKTILELEEWTNMNHEFSQWTNSKRLRTAKKFSRFLSNKCYFSHLISSNRMGNCNDDISSAEHFENSKTSRGSYLDLWVIILVQILELCLVPSPFNKYSNKNIEERFDK